jgi:hypothetical protein
MVDTKHSSAASEQIEQLRIVLNVAATAFDPSAADGGRLGVILAMTALHDFLTANFGDDPPALIAIRHLLYSLADLESGKLVPLLTPKRVKNRPRDSAAKGGFRAFAAVAMDLFMESGVPRKQAARDVATALSRMGYDDGPGKPIKARMVEDWRDRMMTERPAENLAAGRFHRMKIALRVKFPSDPKGAAKHVLNSLPSVARPRNPKNPPT